MVALFHKLRHQAVGGVLNIKRISKEKRMTKKELIDAMAEGAGITKIAAGAALDSLVGAITNSLKKDEKVALVGFGTFSASKRAAREGRNPATGATMKIPSKIVAKFKAGKTLTDAIAGPTKVKKK